MSTERRKEIARNWARKNYHQNKEKCAKYYKEYWLNTTPERKERRKKKKLESTHRFRERDPDAPKRYYKNNKEKWTNGINCLDPEVWKKAEELSIKLVLKLGYKNIYRPDFKFFYFDIISKNDDKYTVFQVTTLNRRYIKKKHMELAKYFGWDFYIIHVKPTCDYAYISRIELNDLPKINRCFHFRNGQQYELN